MLRLILSLSPSVLVMARLKGKNTVSGSFVRIVYFKKMASSDWAENALCFLVEFFLAVFTNKLFVNEIFW